ncbi:MAG TPA: response regulator [Bryobacteraceae bacterium]|nr:response regulator [Bryobacteraceae bacterium]
MDQGERTILVVDDDPQILRLLESMLKPRRVRVIAAARPSEALQIASRQTVHLLISDLKMPEMDGGELAERVLELRPEASVLLISGTQPETKLGREEGVHFLRKPFFPSELMEQLRQLLP